MWHRELGVSYHSCKKNLGTFSNTLLQVSHVPENSKYSLIRPRNGPITIHLKYESQFQYHMALMDISVCGKSTTYHQTWSSSCFLSFPLKLSHCQLLWVILFQWRRRRQPFRSVTRISRRHRDTHSKVLLVVLVQERCHFYFLIGYIIFECVLDYWSYAALYVRSDQVVD